MTGRTPGFNNSDIENLQETLAAYGIELQLVGDGSDGDVVLRRGRSNRTYELRWLSSPTLTAVARHNAGRKLRSPLVAGEHVGERSANGLRSAGIDYIDLSGNAHIEFGDVVVDVRGRRRSRARPSEKRSGIAPNLFSARRMQVIFALLVWPELRAGSVRDISYVAGTSVGLTQSTLEGLRMAGHRVDREPDRLEELRDLWVGAYPGSLHPKLAIRQLYGDVHEVHVESADYRIGGEAAVSDRLRATTLTLYVPEFDERDALINRWRSDREPNIEIRKKFWNEPKSESVDPVHFGGHDWLPVPKLLIYADLLASGESRQREIALELRRSNEI